MKNLFLLLITTLGFMSCSNDLDTFENNNKHDRFSINSVIYEQAYDTDSRMYITDVNGTYQFLWNKGDMVGIYSNAGIGLTNFINDVDASADAYFMLNGFKMFQGEYYSAFAPYTSKIYKNKIDVNYSNQIYDYLNPLHNLGYFSYQFSEPTTPNPNEIQISHFNMHPLGSIICIRIEAPTTAIFDRLTLSQVPSNITLDITNSTASCPDFKINEEDFSVSLLHCKVYNGDLMNIFFMLPMPFTFSDSENLQITLFAGEDTWVTEYPTIGKEMVAGKIYTLNVSF